VVRQRASAISSLAQRVHSARRSYRGVTGVKMPRLTRRQRMFVNCAPFNDARIDDRAMRAAVSEATPIPDEVTEWLSKGTFVAAPRRTWKQMLRNPVVAAIGIAVLVIAGILVFKLVDRLNQFPGEVKARHLLGVAASAKSVLLDPVKTEAGSLG